MPKNSENNLAFFGKKPAVKKKCQKIPKQYRKTPNDAKNFQIMKTWKNSFAEKFQTMPNYSKHCRKISKNERWDEIEKNNRKTL